jgi:hypothetical protein
MPAMFGKSNRQAELIANLEQEFQKIQKANHLAQGDFPDVAKFKESLKAFRFQDFNKLQPRLIQTLDEVSTCHSSLHH